MKEMRENKSIETKDHFKSQDLNDALSRLEFLKNTKIEGPGFIISKAQCFQ